MGPMMDLTPYQKQFLATGSAIMIALSGGACTGYTAVLFPQLENETFLEVTPQVESWIASTLSLSSLFGNLAAGLLSRIFGRKTSLQVVAVPMAAGWLVIAVSSSVWAIMLGRFLSGVVIGLNVSITSLYIGELSAPANRGFFLAWVALSINIGITLSHLLGTFLYWKVVGFVFCIFPILSVLLFCFFPDTPQSLISKDRFDEARQSFNWYRGHSIDNIKEIENMIDEHIAKELFYDKKIQIRELTNREILKPIGIVVLFMAMLQFTGISTVAYYSVEIMGAMLQGDINEYAVMLVIDFLAIIMSLVACAVLKRFKRRQAMIASALVTAISLFLVCVYLQLKDSGTISSHHSYIACLSMALYISAINLAVMPLAYLMIGELIPLRARSFGAAVASTTNCIFNFIITNSAPILFTSISIQGTFLIYAVATFVFSILLFIVMPETKGKTLREIDDGFKRQIQYSIL